MKVVDYTLLSVIKKTVIPVDHLVIGFARRKCTSVWRRRHWNCASSLCTNNYSTKGITYCTLPSNPELQKGYGKVLMNKNINWRKHVIDSAHWSSGKRENKNQLPDIIFPKNMLIIWKKSTPKNHLGNWKGKLTVQKRFLLRHMPIPWGVLQGNPRKTGVKLPYRVLKSDGFQLRT